MSLAIDRVVYRAYRRAKGFFLARPPSVLSRSFFRAVGVVEGTLSRDKAATPEQVACNENFLRAYRDRFGGDPIYQVETEFPVAVSSDDHNHPRGTIHDNSTNRRFNRKLYETLGRSTGIRLLDIGCAGGGFVRSLIEDGNEAIGVEGSDISRRLRTGEWGHVPLHLFTADVTKPFQVSTVSSTPVLFDCITAWEVLEHIPEVALPTLFDNIKRHLKADGIFVGSIDMTPDGNHLTGANYHLSLFSKSVWLEKFRTAGFAEVTGHPFVTADYVRGHGQGLRDWCPEDGDGFHVVMKRL